MRCVPAKSRGLMAHWGGRGRKTGARDLRLLPVQSKSDLPCHAHRYRRIRSAAAHGAVARVTRWHIHRHATSGCRRRDVPSIDLWRGLSHLCTARRTFCTRLRKDARPTLPTFIAERGLASSWMPNGKAISVTRSERTGMSLQRTAGPGDRQLTDKICVITGATSGIGLRTAMQLAAMGARLVLIGRDRGRGEAALALLKSRCPQLAVEIHYADLSRLA